MSKTEKKAAVRFVIRDNMSIADELISIMEIYLWGALSRRNIAPAKRTPYCALGRRRITGGSVTVLVAVPSV